jgi:hypothetical protein
MQRFNVLSKSLVRIILEKNGHATGVATLREKKEAAQAQHSHRQAAI